MTTEEKINQLEAAFKAQIDELRKEVKPKFEVGKWYTYNDSSHIFNITEIKNDKIYGYGHSPISGWTNVTEWYNSKRIIPATDKEVEEALIKEAERRGFKEGVKCHSFIHNRPLTIHGTEKKYLGGELNKLHYGTDTYCCVVVFEHGKWAEIIKDEPIKVGGYEIKKVVEKDGCYYKIGCKKIADTSVGSLNIIMKSYNFKKVAFDGIEVNLETIEKILKM